MATYNDILMAIGKAVKGFNKKIPAAQRAMFGAIEEEIKRLDIHNDGKIRTTARNLSILASIRNKINRVLVTDEYRADVKKFVESFNEITKLQVEYWKSIEPKFKPRQILKALRKQAVSDTVNKLMESGIGVGIGDRVTDLIRTSITTGGSYKKLASQLRTGLLGVEQNGFLDKYAKQVTIDSLNQYSAQYNNVVASDLGYTWFKYDNTLIDTSRPFCQSMREENEYFHISEIPRILRVENLYYTKDGVRVPVPINPRTNFVDRSNNEMIGENA